MIRPIRTTGVLFLIFITSLAVAQTSTVSPYSRFGPGDILFSGFAQQRAMGGTGIAESHSSRLNVLNPASYAYDSLMIFEFGLSGDRTWQEQGDLSSKKWNAKIEYIALGLPLKKNFWGLSFGMMPFNGLGYSIQTSAAVDSANTLTTTYDGKGGFNKYYVGTGFKLFKGLSVGVNASYLFGIMDLNRKAKYSDANFIGTRLTDEMQTGDFIFDAGLHYRLELTGEKVFSAGFTYTPEQKVTAKRTVLWDTFRENVYGVDVTRDTVAFIEGQKGDLVLPAEMAFGLQLANGDKWLVRSDLRYREWSKYSSFGTKDSLENSFRASIGGQYVRDAKGNKVVDRIQYRAGGFFQQSCLTLRDSRINEFGISLGAGVPLKKAYQSMLNFTIELGQRGTTENNLIRERYVRFVFGLTFNENWFIKRRYE
ncbi:MAG: hypothetical protein U0Y08_06380 [Bacteroidia bacterium]